MITASTDSAIHSRNECWKRVWTTGFGASSSGIFTANFFNAKQWADIFAKAGAKYVVMVAKHHDGYALWPSDEASRSWGRPWNSAEVSSKRDLVGELSEAVRADDLKFGLYYSIYEWFNPLYQRDNIEPFLHDHYAPQFKDMVSRYDPEVIFMDGEWDFNSDVWRSEDLLSWDYNESDVADSVAVNDLWGAESRHTHGGYFTTEYGAGLPDSTHPWEENRGLGFSFGYNRRKIWSTTRRGNNWSSLSSIRSAAVAIFY